MVSNIASSEKPHGLDGCFLHALVDAHGVMERTQHQEQAAIKGRRVHQAIYWQAKQRERNRELQFVDQRKRSCQDVLGEMQVAREAITQLRGDAPQVRKKLAHLRVQLKASEGLRPNDKDRR